MSKSRLFLHFDEIHAKPKSIFLGYNYVYDHQVRIVYTLRSGATFMTLILILFLNGIMTMPKLKKIGWCYFCRIISTEVLIWLLNFNLVLFCIWSLYDHQHHASQLERGFLFAILINGLFWAAFCFDDTLMWKKWRFFVQLELFCTKLEFLLTFYMYILKWQSRAHFLKRCCAYRASNYLLKNNDAENFICLCLNNFSRKESFCCLLSILILHQ